MAKKIKLNMNRHKAMIFFLLNFKKKLFVTINYRNACKTKFTDNS